MPEESSQGVRQFFFGLNMPQVEATVEEAGSKGFNLMRMASIGLPVPPGFVIGASFCREYLQERGLSQSLIATIRSGVKELEKSTGFTFGGSRRPMLLSIRSGAVVSMPGMMDTILNVGLCDSTVGGLVRMTGNRRFAWDSYRRLIQTYAEIVHRSSSKCFDRCAEEYIVAQKLESVQELDAELLQKLCLEYLDLYKEETGTLFPQEPMDQITRAVESVFKSWESKRAIEYRRIHEIQGLPGTAVVIQMMVFGNMGASSGSGVAFTRDPSTGENRLYVDFLFNAQGEDVVSGKRNVRSAEKLSEMLPNVYKEIQVVKSRLESEFKDMQDFEFTVQEGKLFILQSRRGNRTPWSALQIVVDLVNEGVIDRSAALQMLKTCELSKIERTVLSSESSLVPMCRGLPANVGVASGEIVLDAETVKRNHEEGKRAQVLVREDISTDDIGGLAVSSGIVTNSGTRSSHAAVVARQMNKVCIVGCRVLSINLEKRTCAFDRRVLHEGDYISLDGNTGNVYEGKADVSIERPTKLLEIIEQWKEQNVMAV